MVVTSATKLDGESCSRGCHSTIWNIQIMRGYWSKCYFLSSTQWDVSFSQEEGILVFHFFFAHLVSFQNKKVTQIEKISNQVHLYYFEKNSFFFVHSNRCIFWLKNLYTFLFFIIVQNTLKFVQQVLCSEQFQYLPSKCTICNLIASLKWYLSFYFSLTNLPERGGPWRHWT